MPCVNIDVAKCEEKSIASAAILHFVLKSTWGLKNPRYSSILSDRPTNQPTNRIRSANAVVNESSPVVVVKLVSDLRATNEVKLSIVKLASAAAAFSATTTHPTIAVVTKEVRILNTTLNMQPYFDLEWISHRTSFPHNKHSWNLDASGI